MQSILIEDFEYFNSDIDFYERISEPSFLSQLLTEMLNDYTSSTNQALMINNYYLCQRIKKLLIDKNIDLNKIWRSQRGLNITSNNYQQKTKNEQIKSILLGQIPYLDFCNLRKCTEELQEIAHHQSNDAIEYIIQEVGHFLDLYITPDKRDENLKEIENEEVQSSVKGHSQANEEIQMLNDMAMNGQVDASLSLFNMYLQGAEGIGIDRNFQMAQQYLNEINVYIENNGLQDLDPSQVYNLAYAELNNITENQQQNLTRILDYFQYAAEQGEINAYNALAVMYMNGQVNQQTGEWIIPQNITFAVELMEEAIKYGSIEAAVNLAKLQLVGMQDYQTGMVLIPQNVSQALENLELAMEHEYPVSFHIFGEIIHYNMIEIPQRFLELYNLTSSEKKCEISVQFYAKSILRGYLKNWLTLADKRYVIKDYEGSYLLNAYASFLGLQVGSFSAGYQWEKEKTGNFKCGIGNPFKCSLYYYFNAVDYYKAQQRIADILYWKDLQQFPQQYESLILAKDLSQTKIERVAYQFYEMSSQFSGYSMYSMAQMIEEGKAGFPKNITRAIEIYDQLIESASEEWFPYEEMYPALIRKYLLKAKNLLQQFKQSIYGEENGNDDL